MAVTLEERFWSKVTLAPASSCWEWAAGRFRSGYGVFNLTDPKRTDGAHRVAYELSRGPIPARMDVCHHCDNPPCVNPSHLFLGSRSENLQDMYAKGRGNVGERNGSARLTEAQVRAIRTRYAAGEGPKAIAQSLGRGVRTIWDILEGRSWKHVR